MHHFAILILIVSLVQSGAALAEEVEQEVSTKQSSTVNTISRTLQLWKERLSGGMSLGYSSNLYEKEAYAFESSTNYSLRLDYSLESRKPQSGVNPNLAAGSNTIRTVLSGYKEMNKSEENHFNDGFIAWVNNSFWSKGKILTVGQQLRAILPTSKESNLRDEKLTGIMVAPSFMFNLTPAGLTGVVFFYQPQVTKNFHKYQQNRVFANNTEYSFSHIFSLNWSFLDNFYFRNDFVYGQAWSYGGYKRDDAYQYVSEVGHTFKNGMNLGLGVSNTGAIRNLENGNDQTIDLFNNKTATVYSDLSFFF